MDGGPGAFLGLHQIAGEYRAASPDLLTRVGAKGVGAAMAAALDLPVPEGFIVPGVADDPDQAGWDSTVLPASVAAVEAATRKSFGGDTEPLLLSVRTSPPRPQDGLMASILNLGLNDEVVDALATATGDERWAYDTYRRFITEFGCRVAGVDSDRFDVEQQRAMELAAVDHLDAVPADLLRYVCQRSLDVVAAATGEPFPQDPMEQLRQAIDAARTSWHSPAAVAARNRNRIESAPGLAVMVQAMVFGTLDGGTGVAWSRHHLTGEPEPHAHFAPQAQGNAVLDGTHETLDLSDLTERHPEAAAQLVSALGQVEAEVRDMCEIEFTVERGQLAVLRVGRDESRSGTAALRVITDLVDGAEYGVERAEALTRLRPAHLEQVLHPSFDDVERVALAVGLAASPGAAVGQVVFDPAMAVEVAAAGESVILVREETSPEDVHGMAAAAGILTTRGGLASHAAVVARGWGTPAVCGVESIRLADDHFVAGEHTVRVGDVVSIDGSTGEVMLGALEVRPVDPPPQLETVLGWADAVRGDRLAIRANADTGEDAAVGRDFGAQGIGLCRTEHMFLGEDRLPIVRQMILAGTPAKEKMALTRLRMAQRDDFVDILEAMDGLPVTVRLLDPPLHEFLPNVEDLAVKAAEVGLTDEEIELLRAGREWQEQNPMMGTRGVRLGYLKPGLYAMQVTALLDAVAERVAAGGRPLVEVMIPLTVTAAELAGARVWVEEALVAAGADRDSVSIGTMVETPRAALQAEALAAHADFFSFGTNDLTQLTFGFSRDDVEGRIMSLYLDQGLLDGNPFESIDADGVGELVTLGVERGRAGNPSIKLGVCGEHGGDPASIARFIEAGLDYVSCSPYRVPVARLAAAQALLAADRRD